MGECNKIKIARVLVEAATPLAVGTGESNILTHSEVIVDVNGLPYIPGTSLTGVIRNTIKDAPAVDRVFGRVSKDEIIGSMLIVSDARIVDFDGQVIDGLAVPSHELLTLYKDLPVRQHVKIGEKGTAVDSGKFDNQVVYKGTRFCFDLECRILSDDDEKLFDRVLDIINSGLLRVGGGTRKGYGRLEAISSWVITYDDMKGYLDHSAELSITPDALHGWTPYEKKSVADNDWVISIKITPDDFVFFGSGFGNENADAVQIMERYVVWPPDHKAVVVDSGVVIPASSVKGAFAQRFVYWYNALESEKGNVARNILFGHVDRNSMLPGVIYFDDIIEDIDLENRCKVFNHVKIDRFTGGAFPGALYNEEAVYLKGQQFVLTIRIDKNALKIRCGETKIMFDNINKAVDLVVRDIKCGLLPLGGLTNRGHGCFSVIEEK